MRAAAYKCDKCNVRGPATKRLGLHVLPDILVLHLKRFFYHGYGQKLDKTVAFGSKLDVRKYLTNPEVRHVTLPTMPTPSLRLSLPCGGICCTGHA